MGAGSNAASGGATILGTVGNVFTAVQEREAANAQARIAREDQDIKNIEATELLKRSLANEVELEKFKEGFRGRQLSAAARSGVLGSASTIDVLQSAASKIRMQILNERRESKFKADQLFRGANFAGRVGKDIQNAGETAAMGTILTGTYRNVSPYIDSNTKKKG